MDRLKPLLDGVPVEAKEFMELYDLRIYDVHSKRYVRKLLKTRDAEGVYILTNLDRGKSHVGKGNLVMRKVFRHLSGYGNAAVYADYMMGDRFAVRVFFLRQSEYDELDELLRRTIKEFGRYE